MGKIPNFILEQALAANPLITADEMTDWPKGLLEDLFSQKVLVTADNAKSVTCDACSDDHVEYIEYLPPGPDGTVRAYISCPSVGRVRVPLTRLRQWRLTEKFLKATRSQQDKQSRPSSKSQNSSEPKRSWTQTDLDLAIREYKAKRASTYGDLLTAVHGNRPGARKSARETYGRNAIVRALGVRSPAMVSKSPEWQSIADELGLRNKSSARTLNQRVGLEIAIEEQAQAAGGTEIDAAVRRETIGMINKAMPKAEAEATVEKLVRGDISDDAAREMVELYSDQERDSQSVKVRQNA